jgi:hypothetical protein
MMQASYMKQCAAESEEDSLSESFDKWPYHVRLSVLHMLCTCAMEVADEREPRDPDALRVSLTSLVLL